MSDYRAQVFQLQMERTELRKLIAELRRLLARGVYLSEDDRDPVVVAWRADVLKALALGE